MSISEGSNMSRLARAADWYFNLPPNRWVARFITWTAHTTAGGIVMLAAALAIAAVLVWGHPWTA